jgi:hypothetical protein
MTMFSTSTVTTGTVPAWAVVFRNEGSSEKLRTISSDTYYGSVSATLPTGLNGGTYEIVIEGMTDEDYAKIRLPAGTPVSAELHLWWKDAPTGVLGDLARFTGLDNPFGAVTQDPPALSVVAVIRVDRMQRRAGARRVEVVVSGRELVWSRLAERRVQGRCFEDLQSSIAGITKDVVSVVGHRLEAARLNPAQVDCVDVAPGTILDAMTTQVQQVQTVLGLYGLQVAMIRDGTLHIGEWTADAATPRLDQFRPLDERSGLLCVERGNARDRDVRVGHGRPGSPASRLTVAVTTLGRPDIKPGDLVAVVLPAQDFPTVEPPSIGATLLSAVPSPIFGDPGPPELSLCRVADVTHKLSREQGFLTTFQALVLAVGDVGWDRPGPVPARPATPAQQKGTPYSDSAHGAASAVHSVVLGAAGRMAASNRSRLGMVHDHTVGGGVPRHTSDIWYADVTPDGFPGAAQRTAVTEEQHGELLRVPYVTPFAWGSYGMVLPRYPGTRVVLANAGGGPGDFVDVGAVWPRDAGPEARPGDYWLALPVSIVQREHLRDPARQLPDNGPATHDLIDGDGTRVIETSRFVLRVTDSLTRVPNRPQPGDDDPAGGVVIESRSGQDASARIVLKDDGSVTITATSITFDTQGRGDIELKANNVKVHLDGGGTMDVS